MAQHSEEKMFTLIRSWQSSGISQMAFCRRMGLAYSCFHYWHKRFSSQEASRAQASFIPVTLPLEANDGFCTVRF
jgi:hypothetical protein